MLTAKRALNFLMDKGEYDNSDLLDVARFSPKYQGMGGIQASNLAAATEGEKQNNQPQTSQVNADQMIQTKSETQENKGIPRNNSQQQSFSTQNDGNGDGDSKSALPKYRKPKPYEVDNSMRGLDAIVCGSSSIAGVFGKAGLPYLLPITTFYFAIRPEIESSIRNSDAYPAYENWDFEDAKDAQD